MELNKIIKVHSSGLKVRFDFEPKYTDINQKEDTSTNYHYVIMAFPEHTETGELFVAYRQLYGDNDVYIRPAYMFFSEVDRKKYPDVKQTHRMEKITSVEELSDLLSDKQILLRRNLFEQLSKHGSTRKYMYNY